MSSTLLSGSVEAVAGGPRVIPGPLWITGVRMCKLRTTRDHTKLIAGAMILLLWASISLTLAVPVAIAWSYVGRPEIGELMRGTPSR